MTEKTIVLTEADNGREVDVARGDRVALRLHEVAGTGFLWTLEEPDASLVEARQEPAPRQDSVGGGGDVQWTITVKSEGRAELRLKLWRRWEGEGSVRRRFALTLNIRH